MKFELSQRFYFEAAHTLDREIETEASRRIHGHTYHVEVSVRGSPGERTGMVVDLGLLRRALAGVRDELDHRLLDDVEGLTHPTLEGLCAFVAARVVTTIAGVCRVRVWREAPGDGCTLTLA